MSFANKYLANLRKIGRKVVLPSEQIKQILRSEIGFCEIRNIIDFGAGTLYWSEFFANIAESSNSPLTRPPLNNLALEFEKSALDGLKSYLCSDFSAQPTNLAQDTRIARAKNDIFAESNSDSAKSTIGGGGRCNIWKRATIRARFLPSTQFLR